jgi:hypothetical protein
MTCSCSRLKNMPAVGGDRLVGLTEDLPEEWIEAVRGAEVPDEFAALDAELK